MMAKKRVTKKQVQRTEKIPPPPAAQVLPENDDEEVLEALDGLKARERLFVEALLGPAGGVAVRAAEMAGYALNNVNTRRVTAHEVLHRPRVQRAIALRQAKHFDSEEWARNSLLDMASTSMANFLSPDPDGNLTVDWGKAAAAGALGQIKEYKEEVLKVGENVSTIKRSLKLHDRPAALRTLLQMRGMLTEKYDVTSGGQPVKAYQVISPDDWDARTKPDKPADEADRNLPPAPVADRPVA